MPTAFGGVAVSVCRSTRSDGTPGGESMMDVARPVGPPPTMSTDVVVMESSGVAEMHGASAAEVVRSGQRAAACGRRDFGGAMDGGSPDFGQGCAGRG